MMRNVLIAVAAGLALIVTASAVLLLADASKQRPITDTEVATAAKELLKRRSDAILAKDEGAWLADVDPGESEFLEGERMRFQNWTRLPLKSFQPELMNSGSVVHADQRRPLVVDLKVQLAGDPKPQRLNYTYYVRFHDDVPRLVGVDHQDGNASTVLRTHVPWDLEPLRIASKGKATVVAGAGSKWDPQDYLDVAATAADRVLGIWGGRAGSTGFVVHLADLKQYINWFGYGLNGGVPTSSGYASCMNSADADINKVEGMGSCLLVLNMPSIRTKDDVYHTMVHEMAHGVAPYALPRISGGSADPRLAGAGAASWVSEGFAEWVALEVRGPAALRSASSYTKRNWSKYGPEERVGSALLPENDNFFADDRSGFTYSASAMFYHAVRQVGGRKAALDFYLATSNKNHRFMLWRGDINGHLARLGVNYDRVWPAYLALVRP